MNRVPATDYQDWYSTQLTYDKVGQYQYYNQEQYYATNTNQQHQQQIPWNNNGYYNNNDYNQSYYNQYHQPFYDSQYDYNTNASYYWNDSSSNPTVSWNSSVFVPPKTEIAKEQKPIWAEPAIISRILSHCSIFDLKNTRLVNKVWNEESQRHIRDRLSIRFVTNRKMKAYLGKMRDKTDFCERFILGNGPRISLASPNTTEFFAHFGPNVRSLDIGGCLSDVKLASLRFLLSRHLPNLEELVIRIKPLAQWAEASTAATAASGGPELSGSLVPHLPKLKKLVIIMNTASNTKEQSCAIASGDVLENAKSSKIAAIEILEETTVHVPSEAENPNNATNQKKGQKFISFLHELLSAATNLEVIESANLSNDNGHYSKYSNVPTLCSSTCEVSELSDLTVDSFKITRPFNEITEQIWGMLMNDWDVSLLKMKEISLKVKMSDECVQKLGTKWFYLTSIDLDFESNVSTKSLQFLFSSLKDSLVHAKLDFTSLTQNSPEGTCDLLPLTEYMPQFKTLQIEGFKGNLRFLEYLPNLQTLKFTRIKFINSVLKDVEPTIKAHDSLMSFQIYEDNSSHNNRQRSVQAIQQIGLLFPSLRKLRLEKLVDESLCLIYAQWPSLEELEIVEGQFTDAGTTSIHPNAYKVLLREEAYERFNVEALRQGLHVGNLTKLRKLSIHSPNITDVSLILGAMQCPKLQAICVKSHQISDTAIQRLANKPSLVRLEAIHCSKLTSYAVQYVQDKLKARNGIALINKPEVNMTPYKVYEFLRKNPRPKLILKRLPEKKMLKSKDEETATSQPTTPKDEAPYLTVPKPTIVDMDDNMITLPLPAADLKTASDDNPFESQTESVPPVKRQKKYKKRVWSTEEGLASTRSKRTITPKIVRDYYRIGYG